MDKKEEAKKQMVVVVVSVLFVQLLREFRSFKLKIIVVKKRGKLADKRVNFIPQKRKFYSAKA